MLVCCWGKEKGERKKGKEKERMLLEKGEKRPVGAKACAGMGRDIAVGPNSMWKITKIAAELTNS